MGTSLALVGAYLLAGELGPAATQLDATHTSSAHCADTPSVMRPYVDRCQDLPRGVDGYAPATNADIVVTQLVMKWIQRWPFRPIAARKWFNTADSIDLPAYAPVG